MLSPSLSISFCMLLLLAGCASAAGLSKTEHLSRKGQQYADTLKKVNSFALDYTLDFTADVLPGLPREQAVLQAHTEAMRERLELVRATEAYLDTQARYFAELGAMAKGDHSSQTGKSLRKLVEALNKAPVLPGVPAVAKEAAGGLATQVSVWRHRSAVRDVLVRDADLVAQALLMNQHILEHQIQWVMQREALARQVEYREVILEPYVGNKALTERWKKAWVNDIKRAPVIELLEQARAASLDMQQAWLDVLQGEGNFEQLGSALSLLNNTLKASNHHEAR